MPQVRPLQVRPTKIISHHGQCVVITDRSGFVGKDTEGFYYRLTRFLSRLRLTVDGKAPRLVAALEVNSHTAIAYYLAPSPAGNAASPAPESQESHDEVVEKAIELQVNRFAGGGFCDVVRVTNHGLVAATVVLRWEIDADFADYTEAASGKRQQNAPVDREWRAGDGGGELILRYRHPELQHAVEIRVRGPGEFADDGGVCCRLWLAPQQPVEIAMAVAPVFRGERLAPLYRPALNDIAPTAATRRPELELTTPTRLVEAPWDRAAADLAGLAMLEGEGAEQRVPAAGIPKYTALFGRDVLVTAFQASWLDPEMLGGSLQLIGKWNATEYDDRFDAEPGRVIHQRQQSPLALLEKNPFRHYYGDYSAPGWFLIDLAWHFLSTGDRGFFLSMRDKALATLDWMDRDGDRDGDGFYEYQTKAGEWGEKNQGWKDSQDAILYDDGRLVRDPIALVEIQGCYYAAKQLMAVVFAALGEDIRAAALRAQADELKQRFNRAFWLPDDEYPDLSPWFARLLGRMPARKATVALANKMARIAWALLAKQTTYRAPAPGRRAQAA